MADQPPSPSRARKLEFELEWELRPLGQPSLPSDQTHLQLVLAPTPTPCPFPDSRLPQVGAMWHLPREDFSLGDRFPSQVPLGSEERTLKSEVMMERAGSSFVNGIIIVPTSLLFL